MTEEIKEKLKKLELIKSDASPKIVELNEKRAKEIAEVNKKYDHLVEDVSIEVKNFEKSIMTEMVDSFVKVVMDEFDAKRSTSEYVITEKFRIFRDKMSEIEFFPSELIQYMDKVIDGEPIESIAYDLEKIEAKYR